MQVQPSTSNVEPTLTPILSGIILGLMPDKTPGFGVEVQRTSDNGAGVAATSGAVSIAIVEPPSGAGVAYFDPLPVDGAKRFYAAREVEAGWAPSAYTAWTTGHKPVQLSQKDFFLARQVVGSYTLTAVDPSGVQPSSNLYLPSTQKITVGTAAASSYATKTIPIDYSAFVVRAGATPTLNNGFYSFTSSGAQTIAASLNALPNNVIIPSGTGVSALVNLATSQELATLRVQVMARLSTDPTSSVAVAGGLLNAPNTSAVGNWTTVTSFGGAAFTLGASSFASYELSYGPLASTNPTVSKFASMAVQYQMPTYDVTR